MAIKSKITDTEEFYYFERIFDVYNFLENDRHEDADNSSETGTEQFTGTSTYEEALDLLQNGDKSLLEKIDLSNANVQDVNKLVDGIKSTYVNDVVGSIPNVPAAIMGLPLDMIRQVRVVTKQKILNISINISVSAYVTKEDMVENAAVLFAAIDSLERQGYRVNVFVSEVTRGNGGVTFAQVIQVKTDKEPFNRVKMAFPLAHPSMLRRITFAINERATKWIGGGYGSPIHGNRAQEVFKEITNIKNVVQFDLMNISGQGITGIENKAKNLMKDDGDE